MAQEASKAKTIGLWILVGVLTFMFVGNGVAKIVGAEQVVDNLENELNVPGWAIPIIGMIELGAAIALAIPKSRFYGAAILTVTMVGAVATHFLNGDFVMWPLPFVLGALSGFVAWVSRPDDLPILKRGGSTA